MFVNKNSIIINNVNMGDYLVEAKYSYNKLWASDSGRNLAGSMTGSLVGIFVKLTLQFKPLTKNELEILVPILDSASQTISYYDPYKKQQTTMETYSGDYDVLNKNIISGNVTNEGFSCSFISKNRRL